MALIKVINKGQNANLIGGNFTNAASETVFNLGTFNVTTNLERRVIRDYSNQLSRFVTPITLETINLTDADSKTIHDITKTVTLNIDKSDLFGYARFGSLKELFRVSFTNILLKYPASLYANVFQNTGSVITSFSYDTTTAISTFNVSVGTIENRFGLITRADNLEILDNNALANLNLSFSEYVIWKSENFEDNSFQVLGFTGQTNATSYITVKCSGNPFPELSGATNGRINFHIKPKPIWFNRFKKGLSSVESFLLDKRIDAQGFEVELRRPTVLDNGTIDYIENKYVWPTSDGYNLDSDGSNYLRYIDELSTLGDSYDRTKTDLLFRYLTPNSIKEYDTTDGQKISKLLRIYGREFDQLKLYIDSIVNVYNVSYNKKKNIPDMLVKNYADMLGWDVFNLLSENDLIENFFSTEEKSNKTNQKLPYDIDIELWRRILINSTYFFRSKGTRASLKSMLLLLGIPEPFINITEYVYTVDGKINPDTVTLELEDMPSASLPYNSEGYPIAPKESNTFYFQISGDTDAGQAYIDLYRSVGFSVNRTVDNKKSWTEEGKVIRKHNTTPDYLQQSSKLIINTKEIDATLDTARGVEYDVYDYNSVQNFPVISSGVTQAYVYINIPFNYGVSANTFTIPEEPLGEIQVNFNGITLTKGTGSTDGDYYMNSSTSVLMNFGNFAQTFSTGHKDVITLTYMNDRTGDHGDLSAIKYVVTRPKTISGTGTIIEMVDEPKGDVQLSVNGISLTKGTSLFTGDYIINSLNRKELIVTNAALQAYLQDNPVVTISFFTGSSVGGGSLYKEGEVYRVDSLFTSKVYYNSLILKTVYVLNYEAFDVDAVKIAINGITLQNGVDFILNSTNKKEVYINHRIRVNDIITAYYVLTDAGILNHTIMTVDTPVSQMSFLEYMEMIKSRLINVKNRKIVTDHNGGFYATLYKVYGDYLEKSYLPEDNFQKSNGYSFSNLFAFTNQFNVAFQKFLKQLIGATVIIRKGGFQIRNTEFTRQKFAYKRGLSFNPALNWFGDDGSEFKIMLPQTTTEMAWSELVCVQGEQCDLLVGNVELYHEFS